MKRLSWGLAGSFAVGAAVAAQSRINGELSSRLDNGVLAALISFFTGLVILAVAYAAKPSFRRGVVSVATAVRSRRLRWWHFTGGFSGAAIVATQGIAVPVIGVAVFIVATVTGQMLSSLIVDRVGVGPAGKVAVSSYRVVGALLSIAGVAAAGAGQLGAGWHVLLLALLPAVAGFGLAWQQAINAQIGKVGGPFAATWVNFSVGTAALVVLSAIALAVRGLPDQLPTDPWLYLGGLIGVAFIAAAAVIVRWIGVLLFGVVSIGGQLVAAAAIDLATPGVGLRTETAVAIGLVALATVVCLGPFGRIRVPNRAPSVRIDPKSAP